MPTHALSIDRPQALVSNVVATDSDWHNPASVSGVGTANNHVGVVCRVPVTGTLHDVMVGIGTQSGNIAASIYDVASGGTTRNRLWSSGSIACPAAGWAIVGNPALAVTAGQLLTLAVGADNSTVTFARYNNLSSGALAEIPAAYMTEGAIRYSVVRTAFPDPGTTWTTPSVTTLALVVVARVTPS
jgi:hypothetical protein